MDLTEFLLARIAEDEAVAQEAAEAPGADRLGSAVEEVEDFTWGAMGQVAMSASRMLAECEAKRRIVEWHKPMKAPASYSPPCEGCWEDGGEDGAPLYPCRNLKWAALPYADHPDYREEWKP